MTPIRGYSDRINHAFAFAAKHHDRQVRKGTRLPYLTHPANIAVILARYGQDEETVVAGILHDVIEDCVRDGYSREMLEQRIGEKFGANVLETVLSVTYRKQDEEGIDLSSAEKKADYLRRLEDAGDKARWVSAADKLHNANSILSDLRRTSEASSVWNRFGGGTATVHWYRSVLDRLREVGFNAPIVTELEEAVVQLERAADASQTPARAPEP